MRKKSFVVLSTLLAASVALPALAAGKQPNILHIVADDLGWKDVNI